MPKGGAREGAGRKIIGGEKRATYSFSLRPSLISKLDDAAKALGVTRSQALEKLLEEGLPADEPSVMLESGD